jgi:hypothetical protein
MTARMSGRQRAEAQRQWRLDQKDRKHIEAEIARREMKPGGMTIADLRDLSLNIQKPPTDPADDFIIKRLAGVSPDEADAVLHQAIADLMDSDISLSRHWRCSIADELRRLYLPEKQRTRHDRARKLRALIQARGWMKDHLMEVRGMTADEAEAEIALHNVTAGSLKQKVRRARRSGILLSGVRK